MTAPAQAASRPGGVAREGQPGSSGRAGPLRAAQLVAPLAIACTVAVRSYVYWRGADVGFDDETVYLSRGLAFFAGPQSAGFAPLYSLWYWVESRIIADPVSLYFANWTALFAANVLLYWRIIRSLGVAREASAVSVAIVSSIHLFEAWPYVSLFALVLVQGGLLFAVRRPAFGVAPLAAAFGAAAFVRPEMALSFVAALASAVVLWSRARPRRELRAILVAVLVFATLAALLGSPLGDDKSPQSFGAHYALNAADEEGARGDVWNGWIPYVERDFGRVVSVRDALVANPRRFLWHVGTNIRQFPVAGSILALPVPFVAERVAFAAVCLALLLLGLLSASRRVWRERRGEGAGAPARRIAVLAFGLACPTALAAALVYYPREHYFPTVVMLAAAVATLGLAHDPPRWVRRGLVAVAMFAVVVPTAQRMLLPPYRPGVTTVEHLRSIPLAQPTGAILEADFGRALYARWDLQLVAQTTCRPLAACLRDAHPTVIVEDGRLRDAFGEDAAFDALASAGYVTTTVPGYDVRVHVRAEALVPR